MLHRESLLKLLPNAPREARIVRKAAIWYMLRIKITWMGHLIRVRHLRMMMRYQRVNAQQEPELRDFIEANLETSTGHARLRVEPVAARSDFKPSITRSSIVDLNFVCTRARARAVPASPPPLFIGPPSLLRTHTRTGNQGKNTKAESRTRQLHARFLAFHQEGLM